MAGLPDPDGGTVHSDFFFLKIARHLGGAMLLFPGPG
jgi:hypothetical protein